MEKIEDFKFIYEDSLSQKIRFLGVILFSLFIITSIIISLLAYIRADSQREELIKSSYDFVIEQIKRFTPLGLFYTGLFGNIMYSTLPIETIFYYSLSKGNPFGLCFAMIMIGISASELINYLLGRKLHNYIFYIISPKKIYAAKRIANKYGSYAIFLFSFVPMLPSPLLTFTLGIAKYKPSRLFPILIIGAAMKFIAIAALYYYVGSWLAQFF